MTSKVNLREWVEGKRVVFHFYLILDTCAFTLKPKFALAWAQETNLGRVLLKFTLLNQLPTYCWRLAHGELVLRNLVLLIHLCYDIGQLGRTVSMPTKSMSIKGLQMYLEHEEVLKLNVPSSLYCFPLGPNCKMPLLLWLRSPAEGGNKILAEQDTTTTVVAITNWRWY